MAIIGQELVASLREAFKALRAEVRLEVYTGAGQNEELSEFSRQFVRELAELSDKISAAFYDLAGPEAAQKGISRSPTVLIAPDRYRLRYTGAPAGEEARSFLEAIFMTSAGTSRLTEASRRRLAELDGRRRVRVFVSPT